MSEPAANPRVSLTAHATAGIWAHYGFDNAELFATHRGDFLFRLLHTSGRVLRPVSPAAGWFTRHMYWRHHWFNTWLEQAAPELAVEIAAGLSARGLNHASSNPRCQYVDYDLPGMVKAKRKRLNTTTLPANYTLADGDLLAPGLGHELCAPPNGPVVVMTEGLVDYFDTQGKRRALTHIAELLERLGGGRYLFEIYPRDRLATFGKVIPVFLSVMRHLTGDDMASHLFADSNAAIQMLRECGFSHARVIDPVTIDDPQGKVSPAYRPFEMIVAEK